MEKKLKQNRQTVLSKILLIGGVLLVFGAGFFTGSAYEIGRHKLNLSQFWDVYAVVESRYAGEIDKRQAVEGVIQGFIESLGDPFSGYLSAEERKSLSDELSGEFQGIGARLEVKNELITVVAPLSGSPAEKAGLKPNDIILSINGESTEKLSLNEAVEKIRGEQGTQVKLTVAREGEDAPREITVTRDNIVVPSVSWKMIDTVAYMEITQFGDDTPVRALQGISELKDKNPTAFILDLRNNPGGYLEDVAPIAGAFVPPSVITIQKFKNNETEEIRSRDIPIMPDTKLFVLVNEGSASASEILAGALQDYDRATLVGRKTYGKGSVQDIVPLTRSSALRLTIAEWLTPKGRTVNKVGIEPDVVVEGEKTDSTDPILNKALELAK